MTADLYTDTNGETQHVMDKYRATMLARFEKQSVSLPASLPPIGWTPPGSSGADAVAGWV